MDRKERKSKEYAILLLEHKRSLNGIDYDPNQKVFTKSDIETAFREGWDACMKLLASLPLDKAIDEIVKHVETNRSGKPDSSK